MHKPLPVGVDNFEKLVTRGYYFIDKTLFIQELLDKKTDVNLFTRPRRFGKTLNMSMLQYFFEDARDYEGKKQDHGYLFDGLKIMNTGEEYLSHMGKYPVINLTLKGAKQPDFKLAYTMLVRQIANEFLRHKYILESKRLVDIKEKYLRIMQEKAEPAEYVDALQFLSRCLEQYYDKKTIILIDEYDVPLENAYMRGFYQQMLDFIRSLFESALKTNSSLEFAVITGCLRISKESIFTGMNNLNVISILNKQYSEYFGFTDEEVQRLCGDYELPHKFEVFKNWYNGYLFGNTKVYNPWSVILLMYDLCEDENTYPMAYWANTSSNSIVRKLIDMADQNAKKEIEALLRGETIKKPIHEDITYEEVYQSMDNLWNFMFFTGYFRKVRDWMDDYDRYWMELCIPNREVRYIFNTKILTWFDEYVKTFDRSKLISGLLRLDEETFQSELTKALWGTISFYDQYESFYHGFLAGMLAGIEEYLVKSNREAGEGRSDLSIVPMYNFGPAYVLEFKIAGEITQLDEKADEALKQIEEKGYAKELAADGFEKVHRYGIAFCGKRCVVKLQKAD
ncbi:MAG: AAA family ATPase [Lachnospiraceae bacterium]|nr:AAA family ATPase [Lachnospiraceae bacterium]